MGQTKSQLVQDFFHPQYHLIPPHGLDQEIGSLKTCGGCRQAELGAVRATGDCGAPMADCGTLQKHESMAYVRAM